MMFEHTTLAVLVGIMAILLSTLLLVCRPRRSNGNRDSEEGSTEKVTSASTCEGKLHADADRHNKIDQPKDRPAEHGHSHDDHHGHSHSHGHSHQSRKHHTTGGPKFTLSSVPANSEARTKIIRFLEAAAARVGTVPYLTS